MKVVVALVLVLAILCATGFIGYSEDVFAVGNSAVTLINGVGTFFSSVHSFIFGSQIPPVFSDDDTCQLFMIEDDVGTVFYYITDVHKVFWGYSFVVGITKLPCALTNLNLENISYAKVTIRNFFISNNLEIYGTSGIIIGRYKIRYNLVSTYVEVVDYLSQEGFVV